VGWMAGRWHGCRGNIVGTRFCPTTSWRSYKRRGLFRVCLCKNYKVRHQVNCHPWAAEGTRVVIACAINDQMVINHLWEITPHRPLRSSQGFQIPFITKLTTLCGQQNLNFLLWSLKKHLPLFLQAFSS
jgi:hypothetical protein